MNNFPPSNSLSRWKITILLQIWWDYVFIKVKLTNRDKRFTDNLGLNLNWLTLFWSKFMLVDQKLVSHASAKLVNQFIILGGKRSAVTAEYSKVVVFYNHFIENFETSHPMSLYISGFKVRKKLCRLTIKILWLWLKQVASF